jgi:moderate conductance mechanosensitive channel
MLLSAAPLAGQDADDDALHARREYDRLYTLAERVLTELIANPRQEEGVTEGILARAIRRAEEDQETAAQLAARAENLDFSRNRVYERLSELEKLEYELRWAVQRRKLAIDEYDHLVEGVFAAYQRYEERAHEGLRAARAARELYPRFAGTSAERDPQPARPPQGLDGLIAEIELRLQRRQGEAPAEHMRITPRWDGRLRAIQRMIDDREDFLEVLEQQTEQLKEALAAQTGVAPSEESVSGQGLAEYQKLGARMEELERELVRARAQLEQARAESTARQAVVEAKLAIERDVEAQLEETRARFEELERPFRLADGEEGAAGAQERLYVPRIRLFLLNELQEAQEERLASARRDTRQARTEHDIASRRVELLGARISEIEDELLPDTRGRYYAAIAATAGMRAIKVVIVFVVAWLVILFLRTVIAPLFERMVRRAQPRAELSADDHQRARTLVSVFMTTARVVVYITALMFAIAQFDVDYGPLLVAAGGVSLAVGFGAQTLVRDFFAGFFILLEGQFSIGDVVDLNGKIGTVENLNLRTTVLRSLDGSVHTIPNGEITRTTNMTKLWSRAVVDVGVAYEENTDDIAAIMDVVAREMQADENWGNKLVEHFVSGVQELADSGVVMRILLKTRAGEQWGAAREYRRRLKLRFDELGVEIPWPQRVVSYKSYADLDDKAREQLGRAKKARILRYVRAGRGELTPEEEALASRSIEERDRADTIARQQAEQARLQSEDAGEQDPPEQASGESEPTDAERRAGNPSGQALDNPPEHPTPGVK